jgi:hypothetical protein
MIERASIGSLRRQPHCAQLPDTITIAEERAIA